MSPLPEVTKVPEPKLMGQHKEEFKFIYKNKEYDVTEYADKHPGGRSFFEKMKDEKKDITEYFRALHSKMATKILKSQKVVSTKHVESEDSKKYSQIRNEVKDLFEPNMFIETCLIIGLVLGLCIGVISKWYIAIPTLCLTQIIAGWVGHSMNHNRNALIYKLSHPMGILHGLSTSWWQFKHNNHHMFTNRIGKDDDIDHHYHYWQYCFLFMKWKYDSILNDYRKPQIAYLILHWTIILQQDLWITLIAWVIAGFYSALILVGNHEREYKFRTRIDKPFIEHQIIASRNYDWTDWLSNLIMGGMQFQTEHHLFPQIPFYRLPYAAQIIRKELAKFGYKVNIDSIF